MPRRKSDFDRSSQWYQKCFIPRWSLLWRSGRSRFVATSWCPLAGNPGFRPVAKATEPGACRSLPEFPTFECHNATGHSGGGSPFMRAVPDRAGRGKRRALAFGQSSKKTEERVDSNRESSYFVGRRRDGIKNLQRVQSHPAMWKLMNIIPFSGLWSVLSFLGSERSFSKKTRFDSWRNGFTRPVQPFRCERDHGSRRGTSLFLATRSVYRFRMDVGRPGPRLAKFGVFARGSGPYFLALQGSLDGSGLM